MCRKDVCDDTTGPEHRRTIQEQTRDIAATPKSAHNTRRGGAKYSNSTLLCLTCGRRAKYSKATITRLAVWAGRVATWMSKSVSSGNCRSKTHRVSCREASDGFSEKSCNDVTRLENQCTLMREQKTWHGNGNTSGSNGLIWMVTLCNMKTAQMSHKVPPMPSHDGFKILRLITAKKKPHG